MSRHTLVQPLYGWTEPRQGAGHMYDLVIRGGTLIDGTGTAPVTADIAVNGETVAAVGHGLGRGKREFDADGLVVAPGWIDIHTHYDGQALWDPMLEPSATHGVTTAVMGNCGVGFAPVRDVDHGWTISLMEGVEDIPASAFEAGLDWGWETFPEYLDALGAVPRAIDVAAQVPHAALRVFVMGKRGIDHAERPRDDEIVEMGRIAAQAVSAGAVGFTTSRSRTHTASDGRVTPTLTAGAQELEEIARAVGRTGRGCLEMVFDDGPVDEHLELARQLCAVSRRPMSIITLQRPGHDPDAYRQILRVIDEAQGAGLDLRGQVAPRPIGLLMSLGSRLHPLQPSATYQQFAAIPADAQRSALRDVETRDRVLRELHDSVDVLSRFGYAFELGDPPRYHQPLEHSLSARAVREGRAPLALAYDILVAGGTIYAPAANFVEGDYSAIREMLVHPNTVPGLSDAGAHSSVIGDFDFPTFLLSHWGRDAEEADRLPLEWLVRRQCADTANLVGLHDRGVLAPGRRADMNLIELDTLGSTAPKLVHDLPGAGTRLVGHGTGYVATIVAGVVALEHGIHTGAMAGSVARGAPKPA